MHRKGVWFAKTKRAVEAGLCLGAVILAAGCVSPSVVPGLTSTPVPSPASEEGLTSVPATATPVPTVTEPVSSVTATPQVTPEERPTVPVTPTEAPEQTPTRAPEVTGTGEPEPGGITEPLPEVTGSPEASVTPAPTGLPEYDTLLRNGWQRTEDFYGERDIYFSGKFDLTELSVSEGRYEYRYRSAADPEIMFLIIGESLSVQQFLEDLTREKEGCLIVQESDGDYGYRYMEENRQVTGRVYACRGDGKEQRMRVEFYSPDTGEISTEGYGFYLR